jgi:dephospho-CoA kinase
VIGRELMEPGQAVHAKIAAHFGREVVLPDGRLDRSALARIAFAEGRAEELNAIVHPAVITRQRDLIEDIARRNPAAVVMVESALIFEAVHGGAIEWQQRFDRIILVTAPEQVKIARFVQRCAGEGELTAERRSELEDEARRRLARQVPDDRKMALCDYILTNDGPVTELEWQVDQLWPILRIAAR